MNDRELLELAAKAAGDQSLRWLGEKSGEFEGGWYRKIPDLNLTWEWNPLTNDGDALRLMAECDIYVMVVTEQGHVSARIRNGPRSYWNEPIGDDKMAAIRRAAVRAAASTVEEIP